MRKKIPVLCKKTAIIKKNNDNFFLFCNNIESEKKTNDMQYPCRIAFVADIIIGQVCRVINKNTANVNFELIDLNLQKSLNKNPVDRERSKVNK